MNVKLISHQADALDLLLYTKNTRLRGQYTLDDIRAWPEDKRLEHLAYMKDTIKGSWEFAWYVFEIEGVSRAFTHQLVRTRTASYAQESHRAVDLTDRLDVIEGPGIVDDPDNLSPKDIWDRAVESAEASYGVLVRMGVPLGDARGILPTNTATSIIIGVNLRTLSQMAEVRLCTKTQGEYQDVFRAMRAEVIRVHPWTEEFMQVYCVNHGTCCFPRYKECPIQASTLTHTVILDQAKANIRDAFESVRHEARPVANGEGVASYGK